jgi:polysaccharide export outer membrane protein
MANTTSGMASGAGALYLMGNTIDSEGFISLPVIGKVMVGGMTLEEAREKIYQTAITYSSDARVDVKLLSFRITIVGEVKAPGYYTIYSDKATLLEGLSMAGDLTYNGKRKNILILRSFKDGTKTIKVDLTSRDLLSSEKYFLQPNDIIYVAPFKTAAFRAKIADYSVFLTLITSTITAVLLINNAFK